MQIIKNSRLTGRQISDIDHLIQECRAVSPIRLSFPFEEGSVFYLAYERKDGADMLVSVLALIIPNMDDSDETFECLAFTRPSCRRKGYFSALFEAAEELFEDANLLIPCDGQDEAVLPVLHSLGAELDSCEYKMERSLTENDLPDMSAAGARLSCQTSLDSDGSTVYSFCLSQENSRPAAVCRTVSFGSKICFYGFLVEETLRGQGFGEEALLTVLHSLRNRNASSLFLHVSGENPAAVNLYKKTGFRITETLSYYLY